MPGAQERLRVTIAILALGGQGGGVLADWIVTVARHNGYLAQATSVPGVAQRTGTTIYYVELFPEPQGAPGPREPIMALMPAPGDVDIVIASELMEAGRAILRGFVTKSTLLISSTHRVYSIAEKSALIDGRARDERIRRAAEERSRRFVAFDMQAIASRCGSIISSVMFGALAGSGALPFSRDAYRQVIQSGGKAVDANLAAFEAGYSAASSNVTVEPEADERPLQLTPMAGALAERVQLRFPPSIQSLALEAVRRLIDYQDTEYAQLYLDRLESIYAHDDGAIDWRLTREAARYLALWMSYEDTIRVADLKIRSTRFARVGQEVRLKPGQLLSISEYMHPRLEEVCDTLPTPIGRMLLRSGRLSRLLEPLFRRGRTVTTTNVGGFLLLSMVASLRRWRRTTLRYAIEQERIDHWLTLIREAASEDIETAAELAECPRLLKGYGDTYARGLARYQRLLEAFSDICRRPGAAAAVKRLREAALEDEEGRAFEQAVASLEAA